jgi:O-antigen/teichoic acid export membrane protein
VSEQLGRSTARAAGWALLATAGARVVSLVSLVVLARLLAPRDFGLLAVALVYITYIETIGDLGTGSALIYWPDRRREAADVTFFTSLLAGLLWFAFTWVAAPWVADFFNNPDGTAIIRALAWSFPIKYLGNAHDALAQKELHFRKRMVAEVGMAVVKAGVSIACALGGLGAWSLVWGQLSGLAVWTLLLWILVEWRPRLHFDRELARPMLRYGRGIVVVNVVAALVHHADAAVVGRFVGTAALGVYQVAYKVPEMSIAILMWVVSRVAFPAFSKVQAAGGDLGAAYRASLQYVTAMTVPAAVGLWIVAEPLVLTLFGPKWAAAIPVLRWIALYMAVRSFGSSAGDVLKATGRTRLLALLGVARAIVLIPALVWASRFGNVGVAAAMTAVAFASTVTNMTVAGRILHVGARQAFAATRSSLVAGVVLAVALIALRMVTEPLIHAMTLAVLVAAGAVIYVGVLAAIDGESMRRLVALFRGPVAAKGSVE